jgi:hypothetical protein
METAPHAQLNGHLHACEEAVVVPLSTTRLKPSTSGGGWRSCRREGPPFKIPHVQPVASYSGELRSRIYAVAGVIKRAHRTSEPRSPRNLVKGPAPPRALLFCSALFLPTSSGVTFHASRNPQRSPPNRGCLDNGEGASTRVGRDPMAPSRRRIAMGAVGGWTRPILPPTSGVADARYPYRRTASHVGDHCRHAVGCDTGDRSIH